MACDGKRPCGTCVKKRRECFDFDKSLLPQRPNSEEALAQAQQQLREQEASLADLKKEKEALIALLSSYQHHHQDDLSSSATNALLHSSSTSATSSSSSSSSSSSFTSHGVDIWKPTPSLQNAMFMFDINSLRVIGCNQKFRDFFGYPIHQIMHHFDVLRIVPERFRFSWNLLFHEWILGSSIRCTQGTRLVMLCNGDETLVKETFHIERDFAWVEIEATEFATDEHYVNDVHVPATFRIPYNDPSAREFLTAPEDSLRRLLNVLSTFRPNVPKSKERIEQTVRQLTAAPSPSSLSSFQDLSTIPTFNSTIHNHPYAPHANGHYHNNSSESAIKSEDVDSLLESMREADTHNSYVYEDLITTQEYSLLPRSLDHQHQQHTTGQMNHHLPPNTTTHTTLNGNNNNSQQSNMSTTSHHPIGSQYKFLFF